MCSVGITFKSGFLTPFGNLSANFGLNFGSSVLLGNDYLDLVAVRSRQ